MGMNRRQALKLLTATGVGTAVFHRAVASLAQDPITLEQLKSAAWIAELELTPDQFEKVLNDLNRQHVQIAKLRETALAVETPPAFQFKTLATAQPPRTADRAVQTATTGISLPATDEEIAFLTVAQQAELIRTRQISSNRLTQIYLHRLQRFGPMLRCVVNLTEELALKQAAKADQEIANGKYRGPLHGIPWGAKDLISVRGYPTTWGIPHFKDRILDDNACVYERLTDAGAVLVAKLSMGAIAMGDLWFEGRTRNPYNPQTGSSGSSAGSAAATVAGLVGFSIGTETLGSITSPSRVCGATGFRPTFGRVSRHGCMPLSWTMDKVGPICRSVEDCALVFDAIHGHDENDTTTYDSDFHFDTDFDAAGLKIGYTTNKDLDEAPEFQILKELGCKFIRIEMPDNSIAQSLANIIDVEAAAGFDQLLRDGQTQGWNAWTRIFQVANFVSAVDYMRMMRMRTVLMRQMEEVMKQVDVLFNVFDVFHTNLSGQPSIVLPRQIDSTGEHAFRPRTIKLTGRLNDDGRLLQLAHGYQRAVGTIDQKPSLKHWLSKFQAGELDPGPKSGPEDKSKQESSRTGDSQSAPSNDSSAKDDS